jgi:cystathionine gamma-synthase
MISFVPAAGGRHGRTARDRAVAVAERTRLWTLAESLGGVESLIEVPAVMTHASVAASPLEVPEALVRLSVGIEDSNDLVADLLGALDEA